MDDGKEFMVVDVVVMLCRNECMREVGVGVLVTIGVSLKEDSS